MRVLLMLTLLFLALGLRAEQSSVRVLALFKDKALVQINGERHLMKSGQTIGEVTLVSSSGRGAQIQIGDDEPQTLGLNQGISSAFKKRDTNKHTIYANSVGMFHVDGLINGKMTRFVLDTGATFVSISQDEADKLGLSYRSGPKMNLLTASGEVQAWNIRLGSVKVGSIRVPQVAAVVLPGSKPDTALLGMSFLKHLKMQRNGAAMVLQQKY
jgi:aspartyl protease family protein